MFDYLPILPLKPSWKKDEKRMKELSAKIAGLAILLIIQSAGLALPPAANANR